MTEAAPPPARVEIGNVTLIAPAPTVMLDGIITASAPDNATTAPSTGPPVHRRQGPPCGTFRHPRLQCKVFWYPQEPN